MAPVDRHEHQQQRVRGAGPSSVQAAFGFNFGALGAKQSSLPPQRSSRRTPVRSTPGATGSAKRHRSASIPRSTASKRKTTPRERTVTPQTGKRKRGSTEAQPSAEDEVDELSPERDGAVSSAEKSRRAARTITPIHETINEEPDELSIIAEEGTITVRNAVDDASALTNGTPAALSIRKSASSGSARKKTPVLSSSGRASRTPRPLSARRSKSTEPGPVTPGMLPNGWPGLSAASPSGIDFTTIGVAEGEESEDELATPRMNGTTPRSTTRARQSPVVPQEDDHMSEDELSSPKEPTTQREATEEVIIEERPMEESLDDGATAQNSKKQDRPLSVVQAEEHETLNKSVRRGRPRKPAKGKEAEAVTTPAAKVSGRKAGKLVAADVEDDKGVDELSPETDRTAQRSQSLTIRQKGITRISSEDDLDEHVSPEPEPEPEEDLTPRPTTRRPPLKQVQRAKPPSEKPPSKRQKFSGPKQAISVMRIKGSTIRGITIADTTRTLLEETIDYCLTRIDAKIQTTQDRDRRKELRSEMNLSLSFKESLNEKLLDLQDANDVLTSNFKKAKIFKRENAELRKQILALQNSRQEVALEHDDIQAQYGARKAEVDAKNALSTNLFNIEAAIMNGRRSAREQGREDEGPEIPLGMLIENVGRDVGSLGGGLFSNVKSFNVLLEKAAGWLEGRA